MNIIKGYHITATERKAIKAIINQGFVGQSVKIGRTFYQLSVIAHNTYELFVSKKGRGIGCGSPLRDKRGHYIFSV